MIWSVHPISIDYVFFWRALDKANLVSIWVVDACFARSPGLVNRPLMDWRVQLPPKVQTARDKTCEEAIDVFDDNANRLARYSITCVAREMQFTSFAQ